MNAVGETRHAQSAESHHAGPPGPGPAHGLVRGPRRLCGGAAGLPGGRAERFRRWLYRAEVQSDLACGRGAGSDRRQAQHGRRDAGARLPVAATALARRRHHRPRCDHRRRGDRLSLPARAARYQAHAAFESEYGPRIRRAARGHGTGCGLDGCPRLAADALRDHLRHGGRVRCPIRVDRDADGLLHAAVSRHAPGRRPSTAAA